MIEEDKKQSVNESEATSALDNRVCRYCASALAPAASVCPTCGRNQRPWRNHFRIDHIGLLIALIAIFIGFLQFREARRDRLDASEALRRAEGVEQSVERLNTIIQRAESQLDQLRGLTEFSFTVAKANNDNREAFDRLIKIANSEGSLKQIASDAIARIVTEIDPIINLRVDPKPSWEKLGIKPEEATFEELSRAYRSIHPNFRPHVLSTIWTQARFKECQRLAFLAMIIREEQSLRALHRACVLMNKVAKINMNILGADLYLEWWEDYRDHCE